jgi:hypothetical protein
LHNNQSFQQKIDPLSENNFVEIKLIGTSFAFIPYHDVIQNPYKGGYTKPSKISSFLLRLEWVGCRVD